MKPIIAIFGRPNVGKSTLFNCITKSRNAIVADLPGLTRDRQYGEGVFQDKSFVVIDTGGIGDRAVGIEGLTLDQTRQALQEADAILFVVDARHGLTAGDATIAAQMRFLQKPIYLVLNKIDGVDVSIASAEFYSLGFSKIISIAASHGRGVNELLQLVLSNFPEAKEETETAAGIKFAIIGRPNVGKSTLVNRILGEERVIVSDIAGTTRDSLYIPFSRRGKDFVIIDTAGVRRRGKVVEVVEKFSIVKTLQAIDNAEVIIFMINAREGIVDHELRLLGFIVESGKALVICVNKWDGLSTEQKQQVDRELDRRLNFLNYIDKYKISALHGTGVGGLLDAVEKSYAAATKEISTHQLTAILHKAVAAYQPPMSHNHRIKLRYAHLGGHKPPVIVIHGNQTEALPESYRRYLINTFHQALNFHGTPIQLQFKSSTNPFKGKKNPLTPTQQKKRARLLRYVKRK